MQILSFDPDVGDIEGFRASIVEGEDGQFIQWNNNPRLIRIGEYNLAKYTADRGDSLDFYGGHVYVKGRNHLVMCDDLGARTDIVFLAVKTLLPPKFKGRYPLAVYKENQSEFIGGRIYCDGVKFSEEAKTPRLQFIGYTIIYSNEYAAIYHLPETETEMVVWHIKNRDGKLDISPSLKIPV